MALTSCTECGRQVSDMALACPGCGAPVARMLAARGPAAPQQQPIPKPATEHKPASPSPASGPSLVRRIAGSPLTMATIALVAIVVAVVPVVLRSPKTEPAAKDEPKAKDSPGKSTSPAKSNEKSVASVPPGWRTLNAGNCNMLIHSANEKSYIGKKYKWEGDCVNDLASGMGILKTYDRSGKIILVARSQFEAGKLVKDVESYFKGFDGAGYMRSTPEQLYIDVSPADFPAWAKELHAGGGPATARDAAPTAVVGNPIDKYSCWICHIRRDTKISLGPRDAPTFKEIAQKYRATPNAAELIADSIRKGSRGKWGELSLPMPGYSSASEAEVAAMVRTILAEAGPASKGAAAQAQQSRGNETQSAPRQPGTSTPSAAGPSTPVRPVPEGFVEYGVGMGPDGKPCRFRSPPTLAPFQFQWKGACRSGIAEGQGIMVSRGESSVSVQRGVLENGRREGTWEIYTRANSTGEIKSYSPRFSEGKNTTPGLFANAPTIPPSQLPEWAREVEKNDVAKSPGLPSAGPAAGSPRAAAPTTPPGRPYKGNLYVMRVDATMTHGGSAGKVTSMFMSAIAPDRAAAERLFEDYKRKGAYFASHDRRFDLQVHECNGAGRGPYFALFVDEPDWIDEVPKLGTRTVAGWTCGAATPEAAAQSALAGCRKIAPCILRPTAKHYLFVSSHYAGGGSRLYDHATYGVRPGGQVGAMAFQQNNYDYTGCFWVNGKLFGEGFSSGTRGEPGNGADNIQLNCRSVF